MNKKLLAAENDLLQLLQVGFQGRPAYAEFSPQEVIDIFKDKHDEAEIRAAFWTLRSDGKIEHKNGKIVLNREYYD